MQNNGFEFAVEVDGKRIREYGHKGLTYVAGKKGCRYTLKFRNNRAERVLVVPTVDNLSVVDGNPHGPESSGYIVQAYSSLTISGWRTSLSEVRAFEFSDKSGSYTGKTVGQQNCGVIGAQVFSEKKPQPSEVHFHHWYTIPVNPVPPPVIFPLGTPMYTMTPNTWGGTAGSPTPPGVSINMLDNSCSLENSLKAAMEPHESLMYCASAAPNSAPDFNLGTAFGEKMQDNVMQATFDRGLCLATFEIYYSDRDGLLKDGIQVDKSPELAVFPQAFGGFCKPPV